MRPHPTRSRRCWPRQSPATIGAQRLVDHLADRGVRLSGSGVQKMVGHAHHMPLDRQRVATRPDVQAHLCPCRTLHQHSHRQTSPTAPCGRQASGRAPPASGSIIPTAARTGCSSGSVPFCGPAPAGGRPLGLSNGSRFWPMPNAAAVDRTEGSAVTCLAWSRHLTPQRLLLQG